MIALWITAGLVAGFVVGRFGTTSRSEPSSLDMRLEGAPGVARTLDDIVEALRAAAQRVVRHADGVEIIDQLDVTGRTRLALRVGDSKRVTLSTIACSNRAGLRLPFAVSVALVPLYGPLKLLLGGEIYDVDGTRDQHQLTLEMSRRLTAMARAHFGARPG